MGLCERDPARAMDFARRYPGCPVEHELDTLLLDPRVQAVSIATPPRTHFELARRALEAGKHVLVEKPLATTAAHAEELIEIAARAERVLMPGHTFVYSPPVNKVRELIQTGELGDVYFVTSSRMNLGIYQADGVISDLAPHDLSILLYWLDRPVTHIAVAGQSIFQDGVPETAFLTVTFSGGTTANVQISWLAPRKMRQMVVVGSKRMVQYDDNSSDESVRIYDRGLDVSTVEAPATFGEYQLTYRSGDIVVPRIEAGRAAGSRAGGLRARDPHGRAAALEQRAGPRDRARAGGRAQLDGALGRPDRAAGRRSSVLRRACVGVRPEHQSSAHRRQGPGGGWGARSESEQFQ